jgi:hypothetical protein
MNGMPLPHPDSEQLAATVPDPVNRALYQLLYRRRKQRPPTTDEAMLYLSMSFSGAVDLDVALVSLRAFFVVVEEHLDGERRLRLLEWAKAPADDGDPVISDRLRAEVLAPSRCAQCGSTPLGDGVKLVVDLRLPSSWGGSAEPDNLQPLCTQCANGKREFRQIHAVHSGKIRHAARFDEPQRRLAELLKAFDGGWVRADLLEGVASTHEYQDDWQRRLRELRDLGWNYESERRYNDGARVRVYYRLTKEAPWPANMRAVIGAAAAARKKKKS